MESQYFGGEDRRIKKLKLILSYTRSSRPAWATDPVQKHSATLFSNLKKKKKDLKVEERLLTWEQERDGAHRKVVRKLDMSKYIPYMEEDSIIKPLSQFVQSILPY